MSHIPALRFYRLTRPIFPSHFAARAFALCFLSVHLPLFAYCGVLAARGGLEWDMLVALLAATVAGTGLAIGGSTAC